MIAYEEALAKTAEQSGKAMYNEYMQGNSRYCHASEVTPKTRVLALVYEKDFHSVHDVLEVLALQAFETIKGL